MSFEPDSEEIKIRQIREEVKALRIERGIFNEGAEISNNTNVMGGSSGQASMNHGAWGDILQPVTNVIDGIAAGVNSIDVVGSFETVSNAIGEGLDSFVHYINSEFEGLSLTVRPKTGQTLCMVANATPNASIQGNIMLTENLTLTDEQVAKFKFQNDKLYADGEGGWVLESTTAAVGGASGNDNLHDSVELATTVNITLSGEQTIDGTVTNSTRVLVKDQTSAITNGVYISNTGAWVRADDMLTGKTNVSGEQFPVQTGASNANTVWQITSNEPTIINSSTLTFAEFGTGGEVFIWTNDHDADGNWLLNAEAITFVDSLDAYQGQLQGTNGEVRMTVNTSRSFTIWEGITHQISMNRYGINQVGSVGGGGVPLVTDETKGFITMANDNGIGWKSVAGTSAFFGFNASDNFIFTESGVPMLTINRSGAELDFEQNFLNRVADINTFTGNHSIGNTNPFHEIHAREFIPEFSNPSIGSTNEIRKYEDISWNNMYVDFSLGLAESTFDIRSNGKGHQGSLLGTSEPWFRYTLGATGQVPEMTMFFAISDPTFQFSDGNVKASMFFDVSGNDFIFNHHLAGTTDGIILQANGQDKLRIFTDNVEIDADLDMRTWDIFNVDSIVLNTAGSPVLGILDTGIGATDGAGMNYNVLNNKSHNFKVEGDNRVKFDWFAGSHLYGNVILTDMNFTLLEQFGGTSLNITKLGGGAYFTDSTAMYFNAGGSQHFEIHSAGVVSDAYGLDSVGSGRFITTAFGGTALITTPATPVTMGDGTNTFFLMDNNGMDIGTRDYIVRSKVPPSPTGFTNKGLLFMNTDNNDHLSIIRNGTAIDLEGGGGAGGNPLNIEGTLSVLPQLNFIRTDTTLDLQSNGLITWSAKDSSNVTVKNWGQIETFIEDNRDIDNEAQMIFRVATDVSDSLEDFITLRGFNVNLGANAPNNAITMHKKTQFLNDVTFTNIVDFSGSATAGNIIPSTAGQTLGDAGFFWAGFFSTKYRFDNSERYIQINGTNIEHIINNVSGEIKFNVGDATNTDLRIGNGFVELGSNARLNANSNPIAISVDSVISTSGTQGALGAGYVSSIVASPTNGTVDGWFGNRDGNIGVQYNSNNPTVNRVWVRSNGIWRSHFST